MRKKTLTEFLDRLNERPLDEFAGTGSPAGAAMDQRPDMSGIRGKGASFNFKPRNDAGPEWPYEDDNYTQYGKSMGNKGRDRGSRPGEDMSGGPPTPRYQSTWEGGPDEVDESPDFDEEERHGLDKYRNVWTDTPDGKEWTELNKEGMGSPGRVGPFAPMDGPSMSSGRDARPVKDENGEDVDDLYIAPPYKDMSGPGNMWGGPGTVPGATMGWANMPARPEDEEDPEKNPMKLREFFDPSPVPVEEIENPEQDHFGDQHDDDLDSMVGPPGGESPDDFGAGKLGGTSISVVKPSPPMGLGPMAGPGNDIVQKSSAWDVLQKVVDALGDKGGPL